MSNDNEIYQEEELEQEIETVEDSEQDDTTADDLPPQKDWEAEAKKLQAILDRKTRQSEKQKAPLTTNKPTDVEETVLRAQGMSTEELAMLKKVATVNGTSLIDARKDELFTTWKEKEEREQAAQKARLGASKGAGSKSQPVTLNTPGLTPEQHKELWKQRQGK